MARMNIILFLAIKYAYVAQDSILAFATANFESWATFCTINQEKWY